MTTKKNAKKTESKLDLGWCLCIATDGEVYTGERTPDFTRFLPAYAIPPLTPDQAKAIRDRICDHYPKEQGASPTEKGAWFFRSDPKTQLDLARQFRDAVEREAAGR